MSDSSEGEDWLPVPKDENQVKRERKLARQKDRQVLFIVVYIISVLLSFLRNVNP